MRECERECEREREMSAHEHLLRLRQHLATRYNTQVLPPPSSNDPAPDENFITTTTRTYMIPLRPVDEVRLRSTTGTTTTTTTTKTTTTAAAAATATAAATASAVPPQNQARISGNTSYLAGLRLSVKLPLEFPRSAPSLELVGRVNDDVDGPSLEPLEVSAISRWRARGGAGMMLWEVVAEALEVLLSAQNVVPGEYTMTMPMSMPIRHGDEHLRANGNGNNDHGIDDASMDGTIDAMLNAMSDEELCVMLRDDAIMVENTLENAEALRALKQRVDEVDNASVEMAKRSLEVEQRAAELRNMQKVIKSGDYSKVQARYDCECRCTISMSPYTSVIGG